MQQLKTLWFRQEASAGGRSCLQCGTVRCRSKSWQVINVFKSLLIVCVGNICRSPTAEYLLRHRLADRDVSVTSAGLAALAGRGIDPTALALLAEHGVDGSAHQAQQLSPDMLRQADLVLAMEKSHVHAMARLAPEASGKVMLLDKWGDARDIPDPYRQQRPAFEHVYRLIDTAVSSWLRYL